MKYKVATTSHIAVLIEYIQKSTGDVLELGIGAGSTPLLHEICKNRKLVSYENDKAWVDMFLDFKSANHEINFIDDWAKAPIDKPWGLVFVDHRPAMRRRVEVDRLKDLADYIVVHDTEPQHDRFYRFNRVFAKFKYRKDYTEYWGYTTVLSNKYPL